MMRIISSDIMCKIIDLLENITDIFCLIIADKYMYSRFSETIRDYDGMKITVWNIDPDTSIEFYNKNTVKIGDNFIDARVKAHIENTYAFTDGRICVRGRINRKHFSNIIIVSDRAVYHVLFNIFHAARDNELKYGGYQCINIYNGINFFCYI